MRCAAVFFDLLHVLQSRLPLHAIAFGGTGDPQTVHFRSTGGRRLRHLEIVDSPTPRFAASSVWLTPPASYSARIANLCSGGNFEIIYRVR